MRRLLLAALLCLIGGAAHAQAPAWQHNGTTSANVLPNSPTNPSYVAPATGAGPTDVNLKQVGGLATAVGAGAVTAGTPRVTLASDDPAVSGITTTTTNLGPPGATACATDTGSCSLNALMQRLAQRLTTINTTLGTPMQATGGTIGLVAGTANIGKVTPAPTNAAGTVSSKTVTNSSASFLSASAATLFLLIKNEDTSASIALNFAAGTAVLNTAGNITLGPGQSITFDGSYVPSGAITAISSAATSPATVIAN